MSINERLDLNFIAPRLLEIFEKNKNKESGDNYTVSIEDDLINRDTRTVVINNNGIHCITIDQPEIIEGKYVLSIGYVNKCNETKSGTTNVVNFITFGLKYEYDLIVLVNMAEIPIAINDREPEDVSDATIKIDLTKFKLLTIGNSWYSRFGFEYNNETKRISTIDNQIKLQEFIKTPFSSLIDKLNVYLDENVARASMSEYKSNGVKTMIKSDFLGNINGYLFHLNNYFHLDEDIDIELGIDGELLNLEIATTFSRLLIRIMDMYKIINNLGNSDNEIKEKTNFRHEVLRFTSFMDFILPYIIRICFNEPLTKSNSKILTEFTRQYRFLELNLKTIQKSGGKTTKQKYTKQKSTKKKYTKQNQPKKIHKTKSKKYQRK
jgi:hypothetical protein